MTVQEAGLASFEEILTTTRAVRKRLDFDRPVPQALLLECLDLALQAPSGANRQGWRWLFVEDPDRKAAIAERYRAAWEPYIAGQDATLHLLDDAGRAAAARMRESASHLAANLDRVPVLVIPCALGRVGPAPSTTELAGFYGSILPAVWSFQLALRSRGVGSSFTTLHLQFEQHIAELLGIPATVTQIGLLPVGYYRGEGFARAPRRPAACVSYVDAWGTKPHAG